MKNSYEEAETKAERSTRLDPEGIASQLKSWKAESDANMSGYTARWVANAKLMKGQWDVDEKTRSEVRGRSKIFFRKIWSTVWRLMASLYTTYLRDPDQVKITGRMGNDDDVHKAGVLQVMVEYHRDKMYRTQDLFVQFVWAFYNILTNGIGVGLFSWEYDKGTKKDQPRFKVFEPEHVFLDLTATLPSEMQFIIFESFHAYDELEAMKYENLNELQPSEPENSSLKGVRDKNGGNVIQNPQPNEYPSPGRYAENGNDESKKKGRFKVWQAFYKKKGTIHYCVTNGDDVVLKKSAPSKYGERYPVVLGSCLTEPHKLIGEGWPEPLEGPQVSLNDIINRRKDNVAVKMNSHKVVSRFANVDLSSLTNSRAGAVTLADDVSAVKELEMDDVTQSAYVEAQADDAMMQEMSGVTPAKMGMDKSAKATTSQINLTESNAKIDLFLAIVGETWMKNFYQTLVYLVQRFDTNENLMRVANKTYRMRNQVDFHMLPYDIKEVDDFDADVIVDVGIGTVNRDNSIRETMMAMEKAVQVNQSLVALLSIGAIPKGSVKFFDTSKFFETLLPKIGYKNYQDFFVEVAPPPPDAGKGSQAVQGIMGLLQNQTNAPGVIQNGGQ